MAKLYNDLISYVEKNIYPFHMPGHKRNIQKISMENPFKIDITEIEGFDDLHHPCGVLKEIMEEAANFYGTKKTYFLINGSTAGILSAIGAATKAGEKILVARNSHKSVYNAVYLGDLTPVYVYPEIINEFGINGEITPHEIENALRGNPGIKAAVITSPTYEGVVSNIKEIAELLHKRDIPLIVDEAHGAHFGMHEEFPQTSINLGADVVIQSIHKTLPSLTQTALLHVNSDRVSHTKLKRYLSIYQSSSPSYILLSSIDSCIGCLKERGPELFGEYVPILKKYRKLIGGLKNIMLFNDFAENNHMGQAVDISKIVLSVKGTDYTGMDLYNELLERYHLQVEAACGDYIIVMTSCFDGEEGFESLFNALAEIDKKLHCQKEKPFVQGVRTNARISIAKALEAETKELLMEDALGKMSAEYLYLYPPGVPIIVPGEVITEEIIKVCRNYEKTGLKIRGLKSGSLDNILVIEDGGMERSKSNV